MKRGGYLKRGGRMSPTSKERVAGLRRATYRTLRSDEPDPEGEPLVYATSDGCWMKRWKIERGVYVERVVRNADGSRARSRPLKHVKRIDVDRAVALYDEGKSTVAIGAILDCNPATVFRALAKRGVVFRGPGDYGPALDPEEIVARYEALEGSSAIAKSLGTSHKRVKEILAEAGIVVRGVGNPVGRKFGPKKGPVSYQTEFERMRPIIRERAGGKCEVQVSPHCSGLGTHVHHRKLRKQGGSNEQANLLLTCQSCHQYLHMRPGMSYDAGLLVRSTDDPAEIPVASGREILHLSNTKSWEADK